jgi:hypothetical protein
MHTYMHNDSRIVHVKVQRNKAYILLSLCMCVIVYVCTVLTSVSFKQQTLQLRHQTLLGNTSHESCMYACMHVCMYACMHVCMYACMQMTVEYSMLKCRGTKEDFANKRFIQTTNTSIASPDFARKHLIHMLSIQSPHVCQNTYVQNTHKYIRIHTCREMMVGVGHAISAMEERAHHINT